MPGGKGEVQSQVSGLAVSPVAWCAQELCSVTAVSTSFPITFPLSNVGTDTVPFFLQGSEAVQMKNVM